MNGVPDAHENIDGIFAAHTEGGEGRPPNNLNLLLMSLEGSFRANLERAKSVVRGWLEEVNGARRTEEPASELRIGLQCGGSDAFSGVSANPLVGWV